MSSGMCFGQFKDITTSGRIDVNNNEQNNYIGENFFNGTNYRSIIECLDGGYIVAQNLLKAMTDFYDLEHKRSENLTSYSNKWNSILQKQSSLSFYNTTKRALLETINSPKDQASHIETHRNYIKRIIEEYQKQVNEMYPPRHFHIHRKHYKTDELEKLFKQAYSPLSGVLHDLKESNEDKKRVQEELRRNEKLTHAKERQQEKINRLQEIKEKIAFHEERRKKQELKYHDKAIEILQRCQEFEEERLNQIQETLIKFNHAVHSLNYSNELNSIFETLISNICNQQSSIKDLQFWRQAYGVNNSSSISISNKNNRLCHSDV